MFYSILTNTGLSKVADAISSNVPIDLTQMVLGDGNGNPVTPDAAQTALINEVYRESLNTLQTDSQNPAYVIAEMVVPASEGPFMVREVGILDSNDDLIAVANFPDTYKPVSSEGSTRDLVIRIYINVTNSNAVTLLIDPSVVLATQQYVQDAIAPFPGYIQAYVANPADNITLATGKYFAADKVRAKDTTGLLLQDANGNGMFIANGGNVGWGTLSPAAAFHLFSSSNALIAHRIEAKSDGSNAIARLVLAAGDTSPQIWNVSSNRNGGALTFDSNSTLLASLSNAGEFSSKSLKASTHFDGNTVLGTLYNTSAFDYHETALAIGGGVSSDVRIIGACNNASDIWSRLLVQVRRTSGAGGGIYNAIVVDGQSQYIGMATNTGGVGLALNNASSSGDVFRMDAGGNGVGDTTNVWMRVVDGVGTERAKMTRNGNWYNATGVYAVFSDASIKQNIQTARSYLEDICKLRLVTYELKAEPGIKQLGFVAQEVQEVFPTLVDKVTNPYNLPAAKIESDSAESIESESDAQSKGKKGKVKSKSTDVDAPASVVNSPEEILAVKKSVFVDMLIGCVQELKQRVDELTKEVNELKNFSVDRQMLVKEN